jgi:hypothetical protein
MLEKFPESTSKMSGLFRIPDKTKRVRHPSTNVMWQMFLTPTGMAIAV